MVRGDGGEGGRHQDVVVILFKELIRNDDCLGTSPIAGGRAEK